MARARNIKPGLYKNEDLAECSIWARYLFPGLWTLADREGRLEDRPKRIKGELLPFDAQDVEPLLHELSSQKFIVRYQIDGVSYIQISKFKEHQSPHYSEKKSVIKPPILPENCSHIDELNSGKTVPIKGGSQPPDSLIPDSLIPDSLEKPLSANADAAFSEFWETYPNKANKTAAKKSFLRINPDAELLLTLFNAISVQKTSDQWLRGIIPHASTWLNNKRWQDEVSTAKSRPVDTSCCEMVAGDKCGMPGSMRGGGVFRCDHHERQHHERSNAPMPEGAKRALAEFKHRTA